MPRLRLSRPPRRSWRLVEKATAVPAEATTGRSQGVATSQSASPPGAAVVARVLPARSVLSCIAAAAAEPWLCSSCCCPWWRVRNRVWVGRASGGLEPWGFGSGAAAGVRQWGGCRSAGKRRQPRPSCFLQPSVGTGPWRPGLAGPGPSQAGLRGGHMNRLHPLSLQGRRVRRSCLQPRVNWPASSVSGGSSEDRNAFPN